MDQGGELYHNPKVHGLFKEFGYSIYYPTGANSSHQNGPVERAHQTIGNALCCFLAGTNLPAKFCPYAFQEYLQVKNALPGTDSGLSAHERHHNTKPDFSLKRTFACCALDGKTIGFKPK
jgi:hypothetical protein